MKKSVSTVAFLVLHLHVSMAGNMNAQEHENTAMVLELYNHNIPVYLKLFHVLRDLRLIRGSSENAYNCVAIEGITSNEVATDRGRRAKLTITLFEPDHDEFEFRNDEPISSVQNSDVPVRMYLNTVLFGLCNMNQTEAYKPRFPSELEVLARKQGPVPENIADEPYASRLSKDNSSDNTKEDNDTAAAVVHGDNGPEKRPGEDEIQI